MLSWPASLNSKKEKGNCPTVHQLKVINYANPIHHTLRLPLWGFVKRKVLHSCAWQWHCRQTMHPTVGVTAEEWAHILLAFDLICLVFFRILSSVINCNRSNVIQHLRPQKHTTPLLFTGEHEKQSWQRSTTHSSHPQNLFTYSV